MGNGDPGKESLVELCVRNEESRLLAGFLVLVAGAGFEPTTFGL